VGDAKVVDYVRHNSRPFIFSASITPASCATALAALRHLRSHPEIVSRLTEISAYARNGLIKRGLQIRLSETPVIPIFTYDVINTLVKNKELFEAGVYVNPVLPPAAPSDGCMLRTSYMATHTEDILDEAMDIIAKVLVN
jgi:7-keto-8-aminopelargonate synthetase-like enzyme